VIRAVIVGISSCLIALALAACPSSQTPPIVPVADADAAPFVLGASPNTPCEMACAALQDAGCWAIANCPAVLQDLETHRSIRMPSGMPLTCAALVGAPSLVAVGVVCDGGSP
jgi:hypothetical protein